MDDIQLHVMPLKSDKTSNTLLKTGILGSIILVSCCFTPVLVLLFGFLGIATWVGYLDMVLLPALAFFISLTFFAWFKATKRKQA